MIKAEVGNDAVDPRIKGTLKAKAAEVLVGLEKSLLIDVLRVGFRSGQVQRQPQHRLIVVTHEHLEGGAVSLLRLSNQTGVVNAVALRCQCAPHGGVLGPAVLLCLSCSGRLANRNYYCVGFGRHFPSLSSTSEITSRYRGLDGTGTRTLAPL